jgi:hypothetical protein
MVATAVPAASGTRPTGLAEVAVEVLRPVSLRVVEVSTVVVAAAVSFILEATAAAATAARASLS